MPPEDAHDGGMTDHTSRPISTDICGYCHEEIFFDEDNEVFLPVDAPDDIFCDARGEDFSFGHEPTI